MRPTATDERCEQTDEWGQSACGMHTPAPAQRAHSLWERLAILALSRVGDGSSDRLVASTRDPRQPIERDELDFHRHLAFDGDAVGQARREESLRERFERRGVEKAGRMGANHGHIVDMTCVTDQQPQDDLSRTQIGGLRVLGLDVLERTRADTEKICRQIVRRVGKSTR